MTTPRNLLPNGLRIADEDDSRNVAAEIRELLEAARAEGVGFKVAWESALAAIEWHDIVAPDRDAWARALRQTRRDWAAAYDRKATERLAAVAKLAA